MTNTVIERVSKSICTGCCACENLCPVGAITMAPNNEGFIFPKVDTNKCTDCGLCSKRCPVLTPVYKNSDKPECRAIWAVDSIRMNAASGGIFSAFAETLIKRGGVACGAAYNSDFTVSHVIADNLHDLEPIKSSKYVQSNAGLVYKDVKQYLLQGKEVLFCGCPCQVAGLYAYLGNTQYSKLYTMDLLCHGVPSPKVLSVYLNENFPNAKIKKIDFRAKEVFGWSTEMTIHFADGTVYRKLHNDDSYYKAFLPCMSLRVSCSKCPFSKLPRQGDLTIGDFWGISRYNRALNDKKGTSLVLINNSNGAKILSQCADLWEINEIVPIEQGLVINKTIEHPFKAHPARKRFFEGLGKVNFNKLVKDSLSYHYDVGIVGLWYGLNYGSVLTYYALNRVITDMGYQCLMINKPKELWSERFEDKNSLANKFIYKNCFVANINPNKEDQFRLNKHCDTFVVGSDVVWSYQVCGKGAGHYFHLDFVLPEKNKIAYASSFGDYTNGNESYEALAAYYLRQFNSISVREKSATEYMARTYGIHADNVLDPVFLCDKKHYSEAIKNSKVKVNKEYISTYFLGPGPNKKRAILALKNLYNIEYKNLSNPNVAVEKSEELLGLELLRDVSVEDWLYYIYNCKIYIGDSFHGLCFAIIFHKPFIVMIDKNLPSRGRFDSLLSLTGLTDRMIYLDADDEEIRRLANTPINYANVDKALAPLIEGSTQWLKEALSLKTRDLPKRDYDRFETKDIIYNALMERIAYQNNEIQSLRKRVEYLYRDRNTLLVADNIDDYFKALKINQSRCIYVVAVKDTPGISVTEDIARKLREVLGIKENMVGQHWKSYMAVADSGKLVFEMISDNKIEKSLKLGDFSIIIKSAALNVGNLAQIVVNGTDYALNKRGFNIVAIDKNDGSVCDSVRLDFHLKNYVFERKKVF